MAAYGGYSKTSYGAHGAEDSGGFFGASQGGGSQGGGSKSYNDTIRPVTIKQIIDAEQPYPDASFRIDGSEITQVTFVGQVRQVNPLPTNVTYRLDDGTGVIEVKEWVNADKADGGGMGDDDGVSGGGHTPEVDSFVRVYGHLKSFNNKRHVGAHVIRPVRDYNEVSYHMLEATYVHLYFTKGPLGGAKGGAGADGDAMFVDGGPGMAQYAAGGAAANSAANNSKVFACSPAAQRVYNFLANQPGAQEGVGLGTITAGTNLPSRDVLAAADELVGKGLLYTTIDDETWAILDY